VHAGLPKIYGFEVAFAEDPLVVYRSYEGNTTPRRPLETIPMQPIAALSLLLGQRESVHRTNPERPEVVERRSRRMLRSKRV